MKTFLAIYTGSLNSEHYSNWKELSEAQQQERETSGIAAWVNWVRKNRESIVEMGAPLGATKRVSREGIVDTKNSMTAYAVVKASSHDEAAKLFLNHPHFTIFPGEAVEVMECLPLPIMKEEI